MAGLQNLTPEFLERFWTKVDIQGPDDCWLWKARSRYTSGYGCIRVDGVLQSSHRIAYTIAYGEIPLDKIVLHSCDNKLCANPSHLSVGTHSKNTQEAWDRGLISHSRIPLLCRKGLHIMAESKGANGRCRTCRNTRLKEARRGRQSD